MKPGMRNVAGEILLLALMPLHPAVTNMRPQVQIASNNLRFNLTGKQYRVSRAACNRLFWCQLTTASAAHPKSMEQTGFRTCAESGAPRANLAHGGGGQA